MAKLKVGEDQYKGRQNFIPEYVKYLVDKWGAEIQEELDDHVADYEAHVAGTADRHKAADVTFSGAQANVQDAIDSKADKTALAAHEANNQNPHRVTKTQVGLGNVDNVKQATKVEFDAHDGDAVRHIAQSEREAWNAKADQTALDAHMADQSNPHGVTKAQVGLGNVDNTADMDKPVSTAVQAALDGLEETVQTVQNAVSEHAGDTTVHITQQEREAWNDKTPKSHASETDEYGAGTGELYGHVRLANRLDVEESGQYALDAAQAQAIIDQIGDTVATVDVAETVTGAPGTDAQVENVGTEKDVLLKFTIPQGLQGPQGEPGYLSPEGPLADIQIGPRTIPDPYTGEDTTGMLTELLTSLSRAAYPGDTQIIVSETEPEQACIWVQPIVRAESEILSTRPYDDTAMFHVDVEGKLETLNNVSDNIQTAPEGMLVVEEE